VEVGGIYYHLPISFHLISGMDSPPTPLNISQVWLEDEDFIKLVSSSWEKIYLSKHDPCMVLFVSSLKKLKDAINKWLPIWKARRRRNLMGIEEKLFGSI
jgi:hypothetical protein